MWSATCCWVWVLVVFRRSVNARIRRLIGAPSPLRVAEGMYRGHTQWTCDQQKARSPQTSMDIRQATPGCLDSVSRTSQRRPGAGRVAWKLPGEPPGAGRGSRTSRRTFRKATSRLILMSGSLQGDESRGARSRKWAGRRPGSAGTNTFSHVVAGGERARRRLAAPLVMSLTGKEQRCVALRWRV